MKFYYGVDHEKKRISLIKSDVVKPIIDEIISSADNAIKEEHLAFKMSEFMLYFENGNRSFFEKKYFSSFHSHTDVLPPTATKFRIQPIPFHVNYRIV